MPQIYERAKNMQRLRKGEELLCMDTADKIMDVVWFLASLY